MWGFTICFVAALIVVKISHWLYRWENPKCSGKLPPGSMGFPLIGETFHFIKPYGFYEFSPFLKKRMSRYGPLFRTSILGQKTIISSDPDVNYEIFKRDDCFGPGFPDIIVRIFGKGNCTEMGNLHRYLKNVALLFVGPESLKRRLIDEMDRTVSKHLKIAASHGCFDAIESATSIIIESMMKKVTADMQPEAARQLEDTWKCFRGNWFQFSFNLPGMTLHKLLSARRKACEIIKGNIDEKKKKSKRQSDDFLDTIIEEMKKEGSRLAEDRAVDIIFSILLASQETSPRAIATTFKLISDNPKVLLELKKEHEKILQSREKEESGVTWQEYKSMTFTHMVINESLRILSSEPMLHRKTVRDVEIKGYTIPVGWYVIGVPSVHFDPEKYDEPFAFNPWRWEGKELHSGSKTFMAFGGGARQCAGAELVKLLIAIFLHYLVTKYRWSVAEEVKLIRKPRVSFPNGIQVNITECSNG